MSNKASRFLCLVKPETKLFLTSVQPTHGFLSHAINAFLNALVADCKTNDIAHYSPENHAALDGFVRIRTAPCASPDVSQRHEPRSVERIRNAHKKLKDKSANLQQTAKIGVGQARAAHASEEREIS